MTYFEIFSNRHIKSKIFTEAVIRVTSIMKTESKHSNQIISVKDIKNEDADPLFGFCYPNLITLYCPNGKGFFYVDTLVKK